MTGPAGLGPAWIAAAAAGATAVVSGLAERARHRRSDPDRVGWVDWRTVQMAAIAALLVAVGVALKA